MAAAHLAGEREEHGAAVPVGLGRHAQLDLPAVRALAFAHHMAGASSRSISAVVAGELRFSSLRSTPGVTTAPGGVAHDDGQRIQVGPVHVVPAAGGVHVAVGFEGELLEEPDQRRAGPRSGGSLERCVRDVLASAASAAAVAALPAADVRLQVPSGVLLQASARPYCRNYCSHATPRYFPDWHLSP